MQDMREERPPLSPAMTGTDLNRWYWLKDELVDFARLQFEYNLFTRAWSSEHPQGTREALLTAWWQYRSTPGTRRQGAPALVRMGAPC